MSHHDADLADVVVVLVEKPGMTLAEAASQLKDAGLSVTDSDEEEGVVEGTILADKAKSLEKLPFVKYVRTVFNYVADFPAGDPRNLDSPEDEMIDEEDAGR